MGADGSWVLGAAAVGAGVVELGSDEIRDRVREFVRGASTEIGVHDEGSLPALAQHLSLGTAVYVAHTPKASLEDVVRVALRVEALGFRASPHIVARRLTGERALGTALRRLVDGGIGQILLVAGDVAPAGDFTSTLEVLDTGLLESVGLQRIGVAGYPEGHPAIEPTALLRALREKQVFGERTGIKVHVVSQFSFNPQAVCRWAHRLAEHRVSLPIHVGISGPTSLPKLLRFAVRCGVKTSLHSMMGNLSAVSHLARAATTPDEMLIGLVRSCAAHGPLPLVQTHFYSFGGAVPTARYLRAVMDGRFELQPGGTRFIMSE